MRGARAKILRRLAAANWTRPEIRQVFHSPMRLCRALKRAWNRHKDKGALLAVLGLRGKDYGDAALLWRIGPARGRYRGR